MAPHPIIWYLLLAGTILCWSCGPAEKIYVPPALDSAYRTAGFEIKFGKKSPLRKVFEYRVLRDTVLATAKKSDYQNYGIIFPKSVYKTNQVQKEWVFGTDSLHTGIRVSIERVSHESGHHSLLGDLLFPPKDDPNSHSATITTFPLLLFKGTMQVPGVDDSAVFFFLQKKWMSGNDTVRLEGYIRLAADSFCLKPFYTYEQATKRSVPVERLQGFEWLKQGRLYAYYQYNTNLGEPRKLHLFTGATQQEQLVLAAYCMLLCLEYVR